MTPHLTFLGFDASCKPKKERDNQVYCISDYFSDLS